MVYSKHKHEFIVGRHEILCISIVKTGDMRTMTLVGRGLMEPFLHTILIENVTERPKRISNRISSIPINSFNS